MGQIMIADAIIIISPPVLPPPQFKALFTNTSEELHDNTEINLLQLFIDPQSVLFMRPRGCKSKILQPGNCILNEHERHLKHRM